MGARWQSGRLCLYGTKWSELSYSTFIILFLTPGLNALPWRSLQGRAILVNCFHDCAQRSTIKPLRPMELAAGSIWAKQINERFVLPGDPLSNHNGEFYSWRKARRNAQVILHRSNTGPMSPYRILEWKQQNVNERTTYMRSCIQIRVPLLWGFDALHPSVDPITLPLPDFGKPPLSHFLSPTWEKKMLPAPGKLYSLSSQEA